MPVQTSYEPGTACWIDLACPDQLAARRFYSDLFGWRIEGAPSGSGYAVARIGENAVAGFRHTMREGARPFWTPYFAVADVDATAKIAAEAGATVLIGPEDAHTDGRTADIADPGGGIFAIWQPRDFRGAELRDEIGTLNWVEYATRDAGAAEAFYGGLFGWRGESQWMGPDVYTVFNLGDDMVGGLIEMDAEWPEGAPPRWTAYFIVEDCDASAARVRELGGEVVVPPTDVPDVGRFAVCGDPQGAAFAIIT